MSLYFYRPAFKSGVMIVKDRQPDSNTEVKRLIRAKENGTELEFLDEDFVKAQEPEWFLSAPEFQKTKADRAKAKNEKRKQKF